MTFTIVQATTDREWQRGCDLLHRVYVGEGYTDGTRAAEMQRRERLEPEGTFLIAIDDSERVMGAVLYLNEDSTLKQLARTGEREFRVLAVHPDARGAGVGEALVRACIERAVFDHAAGLVLWTQPTMLAAQRLYERLGFVRDATRDTSDPRGFTRLVYMRASGV